MANINVLRTELTLDPLGRGYTAMSDVEATIRLNVKDRTKKVAVSSLVMLSWSAEQTDLEKPRILKLEDAALNHTNDAVRAIAKVIVTILFRDSALINFNDPQIVNWFQVLVLANVLSSGDRSALVAIATVSISRVQELGGTIAKVGHIQEARK